ERGLRVYTTLNINMQRVANQALRDGLHSYERRHGWKGNLPNVLRDNLGKLDAYEDDDWQHAIEKGSYVTGLVLSVTDKDAVIKIGSYRGILSANDFAWTGRKKPGELLKVGDLAQFLIQELRDNTVRVQLEQQPGPQGALLAIDNSTGEIKTMVGGYSFEDSKFNRATQAVRQVGSSFKVYVYADALERGATPFDTIVDLPFTTISGGQTYSPRNYDEKFEGTITLRRALAGSRNVPAVKLAETMGINTVVDMAKRFGTGIQAKALRRPAAGKTGTTQDYTDAWFVGYTPQLTAGVWVGFDDKQISLGKKETGARAALPIWLEFMQGAVAGTPLMDFTN